MRVAPVVSDLTQSTHHTGDPDAIKKANEVLDKLDMPDLRLGRAILEACKSCAEQGNVREKMREEKGDGSFFKNIYTMMKHEVRRRRALLLCACMRARRACVPWRGRACVCLWFVSGHLARCVSEVGP